MVHVAIQGSSKIWNKNDNVEFDIWGWSRGLGEHNPLGRSLNGRKQRWATFWREEAREGIRRERRLWKDDTWSGVYAEVKNIKSNKEWLKKILDKQNKWDKRQKVALNMR